MASTSPADAPAPIEVPVPEQRYFNRELSWLAFNRRVLEEAVNPHHPLLERLRFLSISASNLDEFFMVRVAGLKAHQALGVEERSADGMTTLQQLTAIEEEADRLVASQEEVWRELREALAGEDVIFIGQEPLDEKAEVWLDKHFREQIFPAADAAGDRPRASVPVHPQPRLLAHFRAEARQSAHARAHHASGGRAAFHPNPGRAIALHFAGGADQAQDRLSFPKV